MRLLLSVFFIALWMGGCSPKPEPATRQEKPVLPPAKIVQFYASSGEVAKGEPVTVCYGVENAKSVRVEPPVEELKPAITRCFQVTPARDTAYTLIAEGYDGESVSESFTIKVGGGASSSGLEQQMIRLFAASAAEIAAGQTATLCYSVEDTTSVTIEPDVQHETPPRSRCFLVSPSKTTTYNLTATGPGGKKERAKVTVTVR
jgi:hypothetical protein